jgi:hypothetical protein
MVKIVGKRARANMNFSKNTFVWSVITLHGNVFTFESRRKFIRRLIKTTTKNQIHVNRNRCKMTDFLEIVST